MLYLSSVSYALLSVCTSITNSENIHHVSLHVILPDFEIDIATRRHSPHSPYTPHPPPAAVCVAAALSPACANVTFELACDKSSVGTASAASEADALLAGASPSPVASVAAAALFAALKPDAEWLRGAALD
jgi:hypothetical protein